MARDQIEALREQFAQCWKELETATDPLRRDNLVYLIRRLRAQLDAVTGRGDPKPSVGQRRANRTASR
jgi:hypothetical protein